MRWCVLTILVAAAALAGCRSAEQPPAETEPAPPPEAADNALDRARAAADALTRDLMQTLLGELRAGGPLQAVRVCSQVAQERAAEHSREGLTVRRVTLKVRNPADTPDEYERRQLEELEARHRAGEQLDASWEVVEAEGTRRLRYLRPIVVMPPCLACHGEPAAMDPEVVELLDERYPDDEARGYAAGDFRGAVSVTVEL